MLARKILVGYFLALLFTVPLARAQQPTPPNAPSPQSPVGLLLARVSHARGADVLDSPSVVQYETMWIVRDGSGAHVAATLPDIIVPRKTGFWRLGIAHTCQFTRPRNGSPTDHGNISTADIGYAVPVERAPLVQLNIPDPACDPETAKRMFDDSYQLYAGDNPQPPHPNAPSECGWQSLWFSSILPDLISVSYYQGLSETCDPRGGNSYQNDWVQSPDTPISSSDQTHSHIPFDEVFGADGHRAWIRAVTASGPSGDSCLADVPREELDDQTGWSLLHFYGKWLTYAFVQKGKFCAVAAYPKVAVLRWLTHAAPLPIPWPVLEKQLPGISDAYMSPSGSILLAIVSKQDPHPRQSQVISVALFDFSGNKLGTKLLDLPASDIVMAEWASGRYVQSWTDSLSALHSHGLPALVVRPATPSN